uniref:Uncharacterized protein n=1 Tax=Arundo donax TaxID=35708 RepID=A0A0A9A3P2_ARUDO
MLMLTGWRRGSGIQSTFMLLPPNRNVTMPLRLKDDGGRWVEGEDQLKKLICTLFFPRCSPLAQVIILMKF